MGVGGDRHAVTYGRAPSEIARRAPYQATRSPRRRPHEAEAAAPAAGAFARKPFAAPRLEIFGA